ncbi:GRP family sugar transporter, partial [Enterococcus faecalis]|uniref:GRP family sugar transporter n=1 Tax=Enterococcus faecalis TaxID=1351 RepID=UPI003D6BA0C8
MGPLLGWGLFPSFATIIGGRPVFHFLGSCFGSFFFAAFFSLFFGFAFPSALVLSFSYFSGVGGPPARSSTLNCSPWAGT